MWLSSSNWRRLNQIFEDKVWKKCVARNTYFAASEDGGVGLSNMVTAILSGRTNLSDV